MDIVQKFQELLKRLFQFETSDLDFGIYRVLNYKRDRIEKFIEQDLKNKVESAFAKHKDERLTNINQRFEDAKQKLIQGLGTQAFTPIGELKEEFKDTPLGRDFLLTKAQKDEAETIDEIKLQVFNDLYNFFSRYYEEGDFVPQYRYSIKGHKYAIPYNGEEVKLYWANNEQYYTKTGLLFRDYTFSANEYKVIFRIISAREELGAKKATKARFFILDDENPVERTDDKALIIRFQYRELTEEEVKSYGVEGGSNTAKQEKINQKSFDKILKTLEKIELKAFLGKDYKNEKPLLLYQLNRFTAKNTKDYFIHKNFKKFLSEQLDYFIKAEVLDIETLEKERFLDKHITRAKVVREIGEDIIDFLSQIEDYQKMLWEKKKFVLKTDYVITTDRLPENFYKEILENKEQLKEWQELGFGIPSSASFLRKQESKLPVDTKYFSEDFKERLLEKLSEKGNIDDLIGGILIKSENWQALNLLSEKYKEKVQCIYVDPPFNTSTSEILYKNEYKDSSWLSLMADRLLIATQLPSSSGAFAVAIDDTEMVYLSAFIDTHLPKYDRNIVVVNHHPAGAGLAGASISSTHEYTLFLIPKGEKIALKLPSQNEAQEIGFKRTGTASSNLREGRPNSFYAVLVDEAKGCVVAAESPPIGSNYPVHRTEEGLIRLYPIGADGRERVWRRSYESCLNEIQRGNIICKRSGDKFTIYIRPNRESHWSPVKSNWTDKKYNAGVYGSGVLTNIIGSAGTFSYPKSIFTVQDAILAITQEDLHAICMDFFAGSGTTAHAVMKLNKEDGGKRRYILVEMADYFDTVIIPRLKKICYSFNWKNGKPQDTDGISQIIKYHYLEQYEDALDNIELTPNKQAELKFGDDYLLKYFLNYETRENMSLLNIEKLENPFSYKLKVNFEEVGEPQKMVVDIPETFNYLLGLKVKKIKARNNGRKYLFILGEKEGKDIAIVWREYNDNWNEDDFKKDKEFIIQELEPWAPHIVYINGQSVLTPKLGKYIAEIRYIEPEFKNLMG